MAHEEEPPVPAGNWLERKLVTLEALYTRWGREGLKDAPITEVNLLLASKEMQFRDVPKGRDLSEAQKAENRHLELQIRDLAAYVKGQVAGLSLGDLRSYKQFDRPQQQDQQRQFKPKGRDFGMER